jgi:hypothetical protein
MNCQECMTKMLATLQMEATKPIWLCPQCLIKYPVCVPESPEGGSMFELDEMVSWAREFVFHQMEAMTNEGS